jgi:hypothetical protein
VGVLQYDEKRRRYSPMTVDERIESLTTNVKLLQDTQALLTRPEGHAG